MNPKDPHSAKQLEHLLQQWQTDDALPVLHQVFTLTYDQLLVQARICLRRYPQTELEPEELISMTYLRFADYTDNRPTSTRHFFAMMRTIMRTVLVNDWHYHTTLKRGGGVRPISLDMLQMPYAAPSGLSDDLSDALTRLKHARPRASYVLEMKYFYGFTTNEIANQIGMCLRSVKRDLRISKQWLHDFISQ